MRPTVFVPIHSLKVSQERLPLPVQLGAEIYRPLVDSDCTCPDRFSSKQLTPKAEVAGAARDESGEWRVSHRIFTRFSVLAARRCLRSVVDLADFGVGVFLAANLMPPAVEVVG